MVNRKHVFLIALILLIGILSHAFALSVDNNIVDDANVLNNATKTELLQKIQSVADTHKICIVLVTSNSVPTGKTESFSDDFYDYKGYGYDKEKSGMLYLIDFNNRQIYISTTGSMKLTLNDRRINKLLYSGEEELKAGNYGKAMLIMLDDLEKYIIAGPEKGSYVYDHQTGEVLEREANKLSNTELFIALAGGIITMLIFMFSIKKNYGFNYDTYNYNLAKNSEIELYDSQDIFLHESITKTRRPRNTSSSGGGSSGIGSSSHMGSSGTNHGGGGRSF